MRSKTNGELRIENIGETVHLVGNHVKGFVYQ